MTAGRPPRSSSSSKKTITIRVTEEEHAILAQAASPKTLSDWVRETALNHPDAFIAAGREIPDGEFRTAFEEMQSELTRLADASKTKHPELSRSLDAFHKAVIALFVDHEKRVAELLLAAKIGDSIIHTLEQKISQLEGR